MSLTLSTSWVVNPSGTVRKRHSGMSLRSVHGLSTHQLQCVRDIAVCLLRSLTDGLSTHQQCQNRAVSLTLFNVIIVNPSTVPEHAVSLDNDDCTQNLSTSSLSTHNQCQNIAVSLTLSTPSFQ